MFYVILFYVTLPVESMRNSSKEGTPIIQHSKSMGNKEITDETPVVMLTAGQVRALVRGAMQEAAEPIQEQRSREVPAPQEPGEKQSKYVYGLRGIRSRYGVGTNTACEWASDLLAPAVIRDGRKIIVDTEKADKILTEWTQQQEQQKQQRQRAAR